MMVLVERLPWVSLALLLAAYASLGHFLSNASSSVAMVGWLAAIGSVVLLATFLKAPPQNIRNLLSRWLQSRTATLVILAAVAALASFVLLWWHVFLQVLAVLSTEALVRLDIQTTRFNESEVFWVLIITSLLGLALGWTVHMSI